jgi:hypothetical protein
VALNPDFSPFGNPLLSETLSFHEPRPISINPRFGEAARVMFHLEYSVEGCASGVFNARTGRSYGKLLDLGYFPRNANSNFYYFHQHWTGTDSDSMPCRPATTRCASRSRGARRRRQPRPLGDLSSPTVTIKN